MAVAVVEKLKATNHVEILFDGSDYPPAASTYYAQNGWDIFPPGFRDADGSVQLEIYFDGVKFATHNFKYNEEIAFSQGVSHNGNLTGPDAIVDNEDGTYGVQTAKAVTYKAKYSGNWDFANTGLIAVKGAGVLEWKITYPAGEYATGPI
jgi:hypothetical protein